jgi:hypothetical protein
MRERLGMVVALAALSMFTSCGDGDGACDSLAACGGEITPGRHRVSGSCMKLGRPVGNLRRCTPPVIVNSSGITVTGQYTFGADKSYQFETTASGTIVQSYPAACLVRGGGQLTCAQLEQALSFFSPSDTASFAMVRCTGRADCLCTFTLRPRTSRGSGTWATAGTGLTLRPDGALAPALPYCAKGSEVSFQTMSGGTTPDTTTMVLTRE